MHCTSPYKYAPERVGCDLREVVLYNTYTYTHFPAFPSFGGWKRNRTHNRCTPFRLCHVLLRIWPLQHLTDFFFLLPVLPLYICRGMNRKSSNYWRTLPRSSVGIFLCGLKYGWWFRALLASSCEGLGLVNIPKWVFDSCDWRRSTQE